MQTPFTQLLWDVLGAIKVRIWTMGISPRAKFAYDQGKAPDMEFDEFQIVKEALFQLPRAGPKGHTVKENRANRGAKPCFFILILVDCAPGWGILPL